MHAWGDVPSVPQMLPEEWKDSYKCNYVNRLDAGKFHELNSALSGDLWHGKPRSYHVVDNIFKNRENRPPASDFNDLYIPYREDLLPESISGQDARAFLISYQPDVLSRIECIDSDPFESSHLHIVDGTEYFKRADDGSQTVNEPVCAVVHVKSGKIFAGKQISRGVDRQAQKHALAKFKKEIRVAELQHEHLMARRASFTDRASFALIWSPEPRSSLEVQMKSSSALASLKPWFGCLTTAISFLHSHNIAHNDLKAGSVLLTGNTIKLSDFSVNPEFPWRYKPPELGRDEVDHKMLDLWALGCMLLDMFLHMHGLLTGMEDHLKKFRWYYRFSNALPQLKERLQAYQSEHPSLTAQIDWILLLLAENPNERIDASKLSSEIRSQSQFLVDNYVGQCCQSTSREKSAISVTSLPSRVADSGNGRERRSSSSRFRNESQIDATWTTSEARPSQELLPFETPILPLVRQRTEDVLQSMPSLARPRLEPAKETCVFRSSTAICEILTQSEAQEKELHVPVQTDVALAKTCLLESEITEPNGKFTYITRRLVTLASSDERGLTYTSVWMPSSDISIRKSEPPSLELIMSWSDCNQSEIKPRTENGKSIENRVYKPGSPNVSVKVRFRERETMTNFINVFYYLKTPDLSGSQGTIRKDTVVRALGNVDIALYRVRDPSKPEENAVYHRVAFTTHHANDGLEVTTRLYFLKFGTDAHMQIEQSQHGSRQVRVTLNHVAALDYVSDIRDEKLGGRMKVAKCVGVQRRTDDVTWTFLLRAPGSENTAMGLQGEDCTMLFRQLIDWSLLGLSNVQSISLHVPGRRRWRDQRQERFQYDTAFVAIWMHSTRGKSPRLTVRCQDGGRWISGWWNFRKPQLSNDGKGAKIGLSDITHGTKIDLKEMKAVETKATGKSVVSEPQNITPSITCTFFTPYDCLKFCDFFENLPTISDEL